MSTSCVYLGRANTVLRVLLCPSLSVCSLTLLRQHPHVGSQGYVRTASYSLTQQAYDKSSLISKGLCVLLPAAQLHTHTHTHTYLHQNSTAEKDRTQHLLVCDQRLTFAHLLTLAPAVRYAPPQVEVTMSSTSAASGSETATGNDKELTQSVLLPPSTASSSSAALKRTAADIAGVSVEDNTRSKSAEVLEHIFA